jgi:hypothetical protein
LYKGLRYWIFQVSASFPFEGFEDYYDIVLYDCFWDGAITGGKIGSDGVIRGDVQFGQGNIEVAGRTLAEFLSEGVSASDFVHREMGGV